MLLKNKIFLLFFFFTASISHAAIQKNILINYSNGIATYNYSEASWKDKISSIDLYTCTRTRNKVEEKDPCALMQNRFAKADYSGTISGSGLYLIYFYSNEKPLFFGSKIKKNLLYAQYISILEKPTTDVISTAIQFAPKFSFHDSEKYYPISIGELFDRKNSDFDIDYIANSSKNTLTEDDSMVNVLRYNGFTENRIKLTTDVATGASLNGKKSNFPLYWFHQTSGNDLWVTYFVLYAFDEKRNEYLAGGIGASKGSHSIDRESITIKFTKIGGSYIPKQVIYAGHLESQPTTFLGCLSDADCSLKGNLSARWENGKTTVNWDNVSRSGDSPIVYVAHGSHASTPAHGWYFLETGWTSFFSDVTEPAGNNVSSNLSVGSLTAVDLEKSDFKSITYSGYLIKGASEWYRIFPFVRFPIDAWANTSNTVFNDCVANQQGCEKYINQPPLPTPSISINFDSASLTALGATESGGFVIVPGRTGSTTTAGKFQGITNPGYLRIPNRESMQFTDAASFDFFARIDSMTGMDGYGDTVTDGSFAMTLIAKSHDRVGASFMANSLTTATSGTWVASFDSSMNGGCEYVPHSITPLGNWVRVTYTMATNGGIYGYLDKNLAFKCPTAKPNFTTMNGQDLYIGKFSDYWYPLNGAIQDIRIYKKALTASEVQALQ